MATTLIDLRDALRAVAAIAGHHGGRIPLPGPRDRCERRAVYAGYAAALAALAGAALIATYLPARRASRIDPVVALRQE